MWLTLRQLTSSLILFFFLIYININMPSFLYNVKRSKFSHVRWRVSIIRMLYNTVNFQIVYSFLLETKSPTSLYWKIFLTKIHTVNQKDEIIRQMFQRWNGKVKSFFIHINFVDLRNLHVYQYLLNFNKYLLFSWPKK